MGQRRYQFGHRKEVRVNAKACARRDTADRAQDHHQPAGKARRDDACRSDVAHTLAVGARMRVALATDIGVSSEPDAIVEMDYYGEIKGGLSIEHKRLAETMVWIDDAIQSFRNPDPAEPEAVGQAL